MGLTHCYKTTVFFTFIFLINEYWIGLDWRAQRVGLGSAAVRDAHSWAPSGGQQSWSYIAPVCWRLSNLSDNVGRRRTGCCGTFLSLSNRRRGMDGQQPATSEPNKDSGHVDAFQTATTEVVRYWENTVTYLNNFSLLLTLLLTLWRHLWRHRKSPLLSLLPLRHRGP